MKRKIITGTMLLVILGIVLYTATAIYAALTKTTAVDTVDEWQPVVGGTLVVGTAKALTGSYSTILYLESAPIEAVASDGAEYIIQISYSGTEQWQTLTTVKGTAETVATTGIFATVTVADSNTVVDLDDGVTGDFDVVGRKWFIYDGTAANSESVRTKSITANQEGGTVDAVTLTQDVLRAHLDNVLVYDRVDEWAIQIPFAAAYVRVLANNVDADCDVAFTSRVSLVTTMQ